MIRIPDKFTPCIFPLLEWNKKEYDDANITSQLEQLRKDLFQHDPTKALVIDKKLLYPLNFVVSDAINYLDEHGIDKNLLWDFRNWLTERRKEQK